VRSVRFTGSIGVVGVYVPADPGGPDELARRGEVAFGFGPYWLKGQRMGTGQCPVKAYHRYLRELIHTGKANPSFVVSHDLPLDRAPRVTSTSRRVTTAGPRWSWPPPPDGRYPGTAAPTSGSGCPRASAKFLSPRWGSNPARKATADSAQAAAGDLPGQRAATDGGDRGHRAGTCRAAFTYRAIRAMPGPGSRRQRAQPPATVSPGAPHIRLSAVRLLLAGGPDGQPGATGYAGPHLADAAQAGSAWVRNSP
jgi:hypothetical protein